MKAPLFALIAIIAICAVDAATTCSTDFNCLATPATPVCRDPDGSGTKVCSQCNIDCDCAIGYYCSTDYVNKIRGTCTKIPESKLNQDCINVDVTWNAPTAKTQDVSRMCATYYWTTGAIPVAAVDWQGTCVEGKCGECFDNNIPGYLNFCPGSSGSPSQYGPSRSCVGRGYFNSDNIWYIPVVFFQSPGNVVTLAIFVCVAILFLFWLVRLCLAGIRGRKKPLLHKEEGHYDNAYVAAPSGSV